MQHVQKEYIRTKTEVTTHAIRMDDSDQSLAEEGYLAVLLDQGWNIAGTSTLIDKGKSWLVVLLVKPPGWQAPVESEE